MSRFYSLLMVFCLSIPLANSQSCDCVSSNANFLSNPSFEGGSMSGWSISGTAASVTGSLQPVCTNLAECGTYYSVVYESSSIFQEETSIDGNVSYTLHIFAAKTSSACEAIITVTPYNGTTPLNSAIQSAIVTDLAYDPECDLKLVTISGVTPSNATKVRVTASMGACSGTQYLKVDGACLTVECTTAAAGPDISNCESNTFTMTGNTPNSGESGAWSVVSGNCTIANTNSPTTNVTLNSGTNATLRWTVSRGSFCSNSDEITITRFINPSSSAGQPSTICANVQGMGLPQNTVQLNGSIGGSATSATWSDGGAGGSFSPNNTTLNAIYTPPAGVPIVTLTLTTNDPAGPCGPATSQTTITQKPCAGILDPCSCNDVTYDPSELLEVKDFIEIDGSPGQTWRITSQTGMEYLDIAPPFTTTNQPVAIGEIVPEVSPGIYRFDFAHNTGEGYTVEVSNATSIPAPNPPTTLSINNLCYINTFDIGFSLQGQYCVDTYEEGPIDLLSTITDLGTITNGSVEFFYLDPGDQEVFITEFDPLDPSLPLEVPITIYARYVPDNGNTIDCELVRQASGEVLLTECILPVTITGLTAHTSNNGNVVSWTIASETAFSHYEIESSSDGSNFFNIGRVDGGKTSYKFLDVNYAAGNNYYRLKMVDLDGSFEYSKVLVVRNITESRNIEFEVANPVTQGTIVIETNLYSPQVLITNAIGNIIMSNKVYKSGKTLTVEIPDVPAGVYFLRAQEGNRIFTRQILVQD